MSTYDPTLFEGCAWWYSRYRDPYPAGFVDVVRDACRLDGTGIMLDLGCGTGQVSIPLKPLFESVVAVDPDPEMLAEGKRSAGDVEIGWTNGTAEDFVEQPGSFRLAALGQAFHWMDRERVLAGLDRVIEPAGALMLIGGAKPISGYRWTPSRSLRAREPDSARGRAMDKVIQEFLGSERRAGRGTFQQQPELHEDVLARSPFHRIRTFTIDWTRETTIERTIGMLYSTSFCARRLLNGRVEAFERAMTEALLDVEPTGAWTVDTDCEIIIAGR